MWYGAGFIIFWLGTLIKQVLYWKRQGEVAITFGALESPWEWFGNLILSLVCAVLGIGCLIFVVLNIIDTCRETKRLQKLKAMASAGFNN